MGPEKGMHPWLREPPIPLETPCFKHYVVVYVKTCLEQWTCVRAEGTARVLCIFVMWPATEHVPRVHECTYVTVGCVSAFVFVCEVGAVRSNHKLVGHSSAANQSRRKRL